MCLLFNFSMNFLQHFCMKNKKINYLSALIQSDQTKNWHTLLAYLSSLLGNQIKCININNVLSEV